MWRMLSEDTSTIELGISLNDRQLLEFSFSSFLRKPIDIGMFVKWVQATLSSFNSSNSPTSSGSFLRRQQYLKSKEMRLLTLPIEGGTCSSLVQPVKMRISNSVKVERSGVHLILSQYARLRTFSRFATCTKENNELMGKTKHTKNHRWCLLSILPWLNSILSIDQWSRERTTLAPLISAATIWLPENTIC